jgi:hypothetical protein
MKTKRLMIASSALVLAGFSLPALAVDTKGYPGSYCEASAPSGRNGFSLGGGGIFNLSAGTLFVSCPVVKDTSGIQNAQVQVLDKSSITDVSCSLRTMRNDGSQVATQTAKTTGFSSTALQLSFGTQSSVTGGFYTLDCELPALTASGPSGIFMYNIVEK